MNQKVYIIDNYYPNLPPAQGEKRLYVFRINDHYSCIKEVDLEWGRPRVATPIEEQSEFTYYKYFQSYDEAYEYAQLIKELNR